jgi:ABC-type branched-subunit amino acid transport system ATPase component
MTGMTKQYPGCLANDHVSLTVEHNQIHALLGENGAGKSTLVKIIYGVVKPDEGEIIWEGQKVTIQNPGHAQRLGVGMVFQHFSLFEALNVTENIALGLGSKEERAGLRERIIKISTEYGLPLDPDRVVHDLSVGERQRIEIVRCLLQNPKLLIMDEPTSVLTPAEVQKLFVTLRRLAAEGCSILYISHKLAECRARHPGREDRQGTGGNHDQHGSARANAKTAAEECRTTAPRVGSPDYPFAKPFRYRPERHFSVDRRWRNPRHRGYRGQWSKRVDGCAVRRNPRRKAGERDDRRYRGRPYGPA